MSLESTTTAYFVEAVAWKSQFPIKVVYHCESDAGKHG